MQKRISWLHPTLVEKFCSAVDYNKQHILLPLTYLMVNLSTYFNVLYHKDAGCTEQIPLIFHISAAAVSIQVSHPFLYGILYIIHVLDGSIFTTNFPGQSGLKGLSFHFYYCSATSLPLLQTI